MTSLLLSSSLPSSPESKSKVNAHTNTHNIVTSKRREKTPIKLLKLYKFIISVTRIIMWRCVLFTFWLKRIHTVAYCGGRLSWYSHGNRELHVCATCAYYLIVEIQPVKVEWSWSGTLNEAKRGRVERAPRIIEKLNAPLVCGVFNALIGFGMCVTFCRYPFVFFVFISIEEP